MDGWMDGWLDFGTPRSDIDGFLTSQTELFAYRLYCISLTLTQRSGHTQNLGPEEIVTCRGVNLV